MLDVKQSSVKHSTKRIQVPLPCGVDVAYETLDCMADSLYEGDAATSFILLDFVDVFSNVPSAPRERTISVGIYCGRILRSPVGSTRLAQGAFGMGWRHLVGDAAHSECLLGVRKIQNAHKYKCGRPIDIDVWRTSERNTGDTSRDASHVDLDIRGD